VGESHEAVQITGKRGNAVLLSEADPGMPESILEGMAAPIRELSREPGW
jgi:hypothetical protein